MYGSVSIANCVRRFILVVVMFTFNDGVTEFCARFVESKFDADIDVSTEFK